MAWFGQGPRMRREGRVGRGREARVISSLIVAPIVAFCGASVSNGAFAQEADTVTPEPSWHPGSTLSFTGGALFMSDSEAKKWKERQPMHFQINQSFTVAEPAGEFGLGAAVTYSAAGGQAERTAGDKTEGKDYDFYNIGLAAVADYRLAINPNPVVAPRVAAFAGVAMQSQRTLLETFETKSEQFYKPIGGVRAHLELSLLALNPNERGAIAYGYGVDDFVLKVGTTYLLDFRPKKSYKSAGYTLEGGIGFLFP